MFIQLLYYYRNRRRAKSAITAPGFADNEG